MGAYDNPTIIRDRSGETYGKAIADFGRSIGQGAVMYASTMAKAQKEADVQTLKDRNTFLINDEAFEEEFLTAEAAAASSKTPMMDSFSVQLRQSIDGVKNDEDPSQNKMGAKEARYLMMTQKNLSKEKQTEYGDIVKNYKTFLKESELNMGSLIGEKEEYLNYTRSDLGRKSTFLGTGFEKTKNMWTYLSLNNENAPKGVTYDKKTYQGDNGASKVYSKVTFEEDSQAFKNLSAADQAQVKKDGMSITFDENWSKYREKGFLVDIIQGVEEETIQESLKFKNEQGGLNKNYVTQLDLATKVEGSKDVTSETSIVNTPFLMQGLYAPAQNRASVVIDGTPQEQSDFIAFTLGVEGSSFDPNTTIIPDTALSDGKDRTWNQLTTAPLGEGKKISDAESWLTGKIQDQFLEQNLTSGDDAGSGYVKRKATQPEADAINKLNEEIGDDFQGKQVLKGDDIYKASKDISATNTAKEVADPLVQIKKDNSILLDKLYGFDDQKGASDFFKDKTYGGKGGGTITDVEFVTGENPGSQQVTLTWNSGKFTETDDQGVKQTVNVQDTATFDLNNPTRVDTLLEKLLLGGTYSKTEISKMKSDLQKQARKRINKRKIKI